MNFIYLPRAMIDYIVNTNATGAKEATVGICVRIPYRGFEISISADALRGSGDFEGGGGDFVGRGIRIYDAASHKDVSHQFTIDARWDGFGVGVDATGENLKLAFEAIDTYLNV